MFHNATTLADAGVRFVPRTTPSTVPASGVAYVLMTAPKTWNVAAAGGRGELSGKAFGSKQRTTSNGTTDPGRETWRPPV